MVIMGRNGVHFPIAPGWTFIGLSAIASGLDLNHGLHLKDVVHNRGTKIMLPLDGKVVVPKKCSECCP